MAITRGFFESTLRETIDLISALPDLKERYIYEGSDKVNKFFQHKIESVINTILYNLYNGDSKQLKADFVKIVMTGHIDDATEQERFRLLQCIFGSLNLFYKGDYSSLIDFVQTNIEFEEDEFDADDLPFK